MLCRLQFNAPRGCCCLSQTRHFANSSKIFISLDYFHAASNPALGVLTVVCYRQLN